MDRQRVEVRVEVTCTEPTVGHWCDRCALPSEVRSTVIVSLAATLRPFARHPYRMCTDCGRSEVLRRGSWQPLDRPLFVEDDER